jgi:hypothetical protein
MLLPYLYFSEALKSFKLKLKIANLKTKLKFRRRRIAARERNASD